MVAKLAASQEDLAAELLLVPVDVRGVVPEIGPY